MTLKEFYSALEKTPRRWQLTSEGRLRYPSRLYRDHCPLSKVAKAAPGLIVTSARKLGLSPDIANEIVEAADNVEFIMLTPVRKKLLKCCGVIERS
jgi:hypothetical protein